MIDFIMNQNLDIKQLCKYFSRSSVTIRAWRRAGCDGFMMFNGKLFADLGKVESWLKRNRIMKPGPKPKEGMVTVWKKSA